MSEIYSSKERLIIFSVTYAVSLIGSFAYLTLRINCKNNSLFLFIPCVIYVSFFFFLNIISMFDLVYATEKGFQKFGKTISKFYKIFSIVDKILGQLIIYFVISFLESGYCNILLRPIDQIRRDIKNILKGKVETIIKALIRLVAIIIFFVLLIKTKDLDFSTAKDYYEIISNCYSIIEIYACVGFFIYQIFFDCRRRRDGQLISRYYRYSIIKIIEEAEKYTQKLKKSYDILNEAVDNLDNNDSSRYSKFLKAHQKTAKEYINIYGLDKNNEDNKNLNDNNNNNINANDINNNNNFISINNNNNVNYNNNNNFIYINSNNNFINNNNHYINYPNMYSNSYNYMNENINSNSNNIYSNNIVYINEPDFHNYNPAAYDRNYRQNNLENNSRQNNVRNQNNANRELSREQTQSQRQEVKKDEKEDKKEEKDDIPTSIRKYKKSVRKITKLQKLYKEINDEKNNELTKLNQDKKCSWQLVILFIAFSIIIITDFLLPFINGSEEENNNDDDKKEEEYEKEESSLHLAIGVLLSISISIITSSYTIVRIYSTTRSQYISGDFLYDKQINDIISLVKTVKVICGDAFALVYCNLYFWIVIYEEGDGKPYFYKETTIPDYKIVSGISVYMLAKIFVIIISAIGSLCFNKFYLFENDLAEYNLSQYGCIYDDDNELNQKLEEKKIIVNILNK